MRARANPACCSASPTLLLHIVGISLCLQGWGFACGFLAEKLGAHPGASSLRTQTMLVESRQEAGTCVTQSCVSQQGRSP